MTPTDRTRAAGRTLLSALASVCLCTVAACSGAAMTPERSDEASARVGDGSRAAPRDDADAASNAAAEQLRPTGAPAPAPRAVPSQASSRVLGKGPRTLVDGKRVCEVRFVYAGREPEEVFWEEPCADTDARMLTRGELQALGRWERLDATEQGYVAAMPGGRVLYVGGGFSASVYPVDETGTSIEVAVAD